MQGDVDPKYVCMYVCSGVEWSGVDTHTGGVRGGDLGEGSGVRHASFVMRHHPKHIIKAQATKSEGSHYTLKSIQKMMKMTKRFASHKPHELQISVFSAGRGGPRFEPLREARCKGRPNSHLLA